MAEIMKRQYTTNVNQTNEKCKTKNKREQRPRSRIHDIKKLEQQIGGDQEGKVVVVEEEEEEEGDDDDDNVVESSTKPMSE